MTSLALTQLNNFCYTLQLEVKLRKIHEFRRPCHAQLTRWKLDLILWMLICMHSKVLPFALVAPTNSVCLSFTESSYLSRSVLQEVLDQKDTFQS
ncbi:hypothetical protein SLEP1_g37850 [Rubroshorea leprosula]|uniref:Uncharacterized protein n=2 Tax=Rubroshorea leprosula TaxID=152421 RepID=A0AAV5KWB5_9ROSI|nr:hypothetical protein SLEP1_g37850 [Rubroshorea leprosula]